MTVDTEALIAAVRAGDIEAAQALLPADPIVKRAREICARHLGGPSRWLSGELDEQNMMGAVLEALRNPAQIKIDETTILRMARFACYFGIVKIAESDSWSRWRSDQIICGDADHSDLVTEMAATLQAALVGNPPVVPAMTA